MMIAQVLEAAMLICFGLSWPINAYKNFKAGTAAGTSWQFILLITVGYLAGIAAKFASGMINWVLAVYFINLICLAVNWAVYFRNRRLDAARLANETATQVLDSSVSNLLIATDGSKASLEAITFAAHAIDKRFRGKRHSRNRCSQERNAGPRKRWHQGNRKGLHGRSCRRYRGRSARHSGEPGRYGLARPERYQGTAPWQRKPQRKRKRELPGPYREIAHNTAPSLPPA